MSETQARPSAPRGRGSGRGRSGYSSRGSRGSRHTTNGTKSDHVEVVEDEGEIGELKKKYSSQLNTIKEMFPDWTQEDLVFALQETDGDIESTIERITEGSFCLSFHTINAVLPRRVIRQNDDNANCLSATGTVSQWGEVKKKDRSRSKVKDVASAGATDSTTAPPGRGSRGRGGVEGSRGGRSRGSERGRGGGRGARGGSVVPTSGSRPPKGHAEVKETPQAPVAADEHNTSETSKVADSWESTPSTETTADGWVSVTAAPPPKVTPEPQKSSIVGDGPKKSWASIFSKPVIPPIPKKVPAATPKALGPSTPGPKVEHETLPLAPAVAEASDLTEAVTPTTSAAEPVITPSKDELTETNLEQLPDVSGPAPSATEASTVATSKDPRGTPFSGTTLQETSRPPTSGYAVSAFKATGSTGRTSSFQRRVLDQQEAVIMPGNHAVDRTAVQFGSLGLNGAGDDPDVDDDREEAETRAQPPQHSPVAHPRASLPPVSQAQPVADTTTPTQAPGLPAAPSQPQSMTSQQPSSQAPLGSQMMAQQISQGNHQYSQFGRYNQQSLPQEQASSPPKAYDAFGQPSHAPSQQSELDGYPSHTQAGQSQMQPSQQSHIGTQSSAGSDYPSYYTSDNNSRGGFSNYYQSPYGHQDARSSLDVGGSQQRAASGFGQTTADSTSQYPSSQAPQPQSRYAQASDIHNSGQNTPNSTAPGQQPPQSTQGQQPHLQQGQGQAGGAYPYTHPYYNQYYSAYMNQVCFPLALPRFLNLD